MLIILKKQTYLLWALLIGIYTVSFAQKKDVVRSYLPSQNQSRSNELQVNDRMICAWEGTDLRSAPGEKQPSTTKLAFGDEVELLGQRAYVISEARDYLEVKLTGKNTQGWVKESLIVNGGLVVVLKTTEYFESYNNPLTVSDGAFFEAGELAILSDFVEDGEYIKLVGRNRGQGGLKEGWIKGLERVSVRRNDLTIAGRIYEAQKTKDPRLQREALTRIRSLPEFQRSNMELALEHAIHRTYYPGDISYTPAKPSSSTKSGTTSTKRKKTTKKPAMKKGDPNLVVEKVVDMDTGKYYNRITETGAIMEVNGPKRPKSIYWCYHKTRPINSEILLHVPNGGVVAVTVVDRLRQNNPHVIGMGKKLLERVYGTRFAKKATFSYPQ